MISIFVRKYRRDCECPSRVTRRKGGSALPETSMPRPWYCGPLPLSDFFKNQRNELAVRDSLKRQETRFPSMIIVGRTTD
jgi:hypothetical protein